MLLRYLPLWKDLQEVLQEKGKTFTFICKKKIESEVRINEGSWMKEKGKIITF